MIQPSSRYYQSERGIHRMPDGRQVAYLRRRFLPLTEDVGPTVAVSVMAGDRLDLIAAQTLGDPQQFWRIGDVNLLMDPFALVPGTKLRIPRPGR